MQEFADYEELHIKCIQKEIVRLQKLNQLQDNAIVRLQNLNQVQDNTITDQQQYTNSLESLVTGLGGNISANKKNSPYDDEYDEEYVNVDV